MPVPENGNTMPRKAERLNALQRAADFIGRDALAASMGVSLRMVGFYLEPARNIPPLSLTNVARALDARAAELTTHAERLRELAR